MPRRKPDIIRNMHIRSALNKQPNNRRKVLPQCRVQSCLLILLPLLHIHPAIQQRPRGLRIAKGRSALGGYLPMQGRCEIRRSACTQQLLDYIGVVGVHRCEKELRAFSEHLVEGAGTLTSHANEFYHFGLAVGDSLGYSLG
ncbi:hypothetical protein BDV12DRAFT_204321 [Aspergillus spectabilis]